MVIEEWENWSSWDCSSLMFFIAADLFCASYTCSVFSFTEGLHMASSVFVCYMLLIQKYAWTECWEWQYCKGWRERNRGNRFWYSNLLVYALQNIIQLSAVWEQCKGNSQWLYQSYNFTICFKRPYHFLSAYHSTTVWSIF